MEWNSEGYCLTKVGRDSRLVVRKQVKTLTVLYLVPYQHFGVDFAPYQILLVMGAIFVLLAIPFLLFYDRTVLPLCNRCLPRQECTCMPAATALL